MKVLSIQTGHNATVAVADKGVIIGALSQEKCDNIKNSAVFPSDAIKQILAEVGWDISDVDKILIASLRVHPPKNDQYKYDSKKRVKDSSVTLRAVKSLRDGLPGKLAPGLFATLKRIRGRALDQQGKEYLRKMLSKEGFQGVPIEHVEHHLCHARSAYHSLNPKAEQNQPALIFTLDGAGDDSCATVTKVDENGRWEQLASTPIPSSLGNIYSNTTRFLGMKVQEHEYKVMGLAPYAKGNYMLEVYKRIFEPTIFLSKQNPLVFESTLNTSQFYDYLVEHAVGERFDNLAAAVQHLTETLVIQWIKNAIEQTGIRRIFTGGGVFMNVKLNMLIQQMEDVEQVYFMPSCGDESNPIGACYDHAVRNGFEVEPLRNLYLGLSFDDQHIETFIERNDLKERYEVEKFENIEEKIAELLADRQIVARAAGRCEWGARSLGNRAILAHPSYMESFYTVNDYIKSRDFWMPFAPSMLDTAAFSYLEGYDPDKSKSPHMITAFSATELGVEHLRAALHQGDHTLRPQIVDVDASPDYYRLIKKFEELTGVGAVLNTSFNLHGFPLAATPDQALMTLEKSELKYLALGNYLIKKKSR